MMPKRKVLLVVNDLQCGSELGIANPDTKIWTRDEENKRKLTPIEANPAQRYLWDTFDWGATEALKFAGKDDVILIVNGDMTDGNYYFEGKSQAGENNQVRMAYDVIDRIAHYKQVKAIRFTSSTRVHANTENSADNALVDRFIDKYQDKDIRYIEHGLANIGGVYVDFAHHGSGGGIRQWTKGNVFQLYVKDIVHQSFDDGLPIPHIVLRAHKHVQIQVHHAPQFGDRTTETWGFIVPSFQLLTDYARKITSSTPKVVNGMLAIEIIDGEIGRRKWYTRIKSVRTVEKI